MVKEAKTLFSREDDSYAFDEMDEAGKADCISVGECSSSCRSKAGCTSCARRTADEPEGLAIHVTHLEH
jgi:hypothetical protein